ncbi:hypothetical protein DFH09DRAFT_1194035 [Mycena vulgaris]|nr:hypothetical protein DFH09DRAFT_1194035 [Mycena vulgaris]
MNKSPSIFSLGASRSSSHLPVETGRWSSQFAVEAEGPKRRSFLAAVFSHSRSRSADARDMPPPSYDTVVAPQRSKSSAKYGSSKWLQKPMRKETLEDALEILRKYDTVILVDDSASMSLAGSKNGVTRWYEAGQALEALAEAAQQYDTDGIDIYFLNSKTEALNMKSSADVKAVFESIKPNGSTPTGERLDQLLKPYLIKLEESEIQPDGTPREKTGTKEVIKRVNFIVITDGEATDYPKGPIVDAATRLKKMTNLCMIQLGIQFVQVGNDAGATRSLKELDDDLHKAGDIRDIVDTTPYSKLNPVTADGLIKVLLGGINRRIDEQNSMK